MSINVKKYTKDQMAKMVEDAAERLKSQKKENEELAEQLKSQTAKTIALRNDLMAKMHSNEKLDQMNGEAINKTNEIANLKADADALRNKLADTEAALVRANALCAQFQSNLTLASEACYNAEQRTSYVESHPWRNLWAWVKKKLKMA